MTHTSLAQQSLMTAGKEKAVMFGYVCYVVIAALTRANSRLVIYSPRMTSAQFVELVQLCPDPAMLGCKLFAMINSNELATLSNQASKSSPPKCNSVTISVCRTVCPS